MRSVLGTDPDGSAVFAAADPDGKWRFAMFTFPDGTASFVASNREGNETWGEVPP